MTATPSAATQTTINSLGNFEMPKQSVVYESVISPVVKVDDLPRTIFGTGLTILQLLALVAAFYATIMFQIPALPVGEKWTVQVQTGSQILFGIAVYVIAFKLLTNLFGK